MPAPCPALAHDAQHASTERARRPRGGRPRSLADGPGPANEVDLARRVGVSQGRRELVVLQYQRRRSYPSLKPTRLDLNWVCGEQCACGWRTGRLGPSRPPCHRHGHEQDVAQPEQRIVVGRVVGRRETRRQELPRARQRAAHIPLCPRLREHSERGTSDGRTQVMTGDRMAVLRQRLKPNATNGQTRTEAGRYACSETAVRAWDATGTLRMHTGTG